MPEPRTNSSGESRDEVSRLSGLYPPSTTTALPGISSALFPTSSPELEVVAVAVGTSVRSAMSPSSQGTRVTIVFNAL